MGGEVSLGSKIFAGFDDAGAEQHLPEAVDCDASCERVFGINEPAGEA